MSSTDQREAWSVNKMQLLFFIIPFNLIHWSNWTLSLAGDLALKLQLPTSFRSECNGKLASTPYHYPCPTLWLLFVSFQVEDEKTKIIEQDSSYLAGVFAVSGSGQWAELTLSFLGRLFRTLVGSCLPSGSFPCWSDPSTRLQTTWWQDLVVLFPTKLLAPRTVPGT